MNYDGVQKQTPRKTFTYNGKSMRDKIHELYVLVHPMSSTSDGAGPPFSTRAMASCRVKQSYAFCFLPSDGQAGERVWTGLDTSGAAGSHREGGLGCWGRLVSAGARNARRRP